MITKRQSEVLEFIRSYTVEHGYAPTNAEIGAKLGVTSSATVFKHLDNLYRKGLLVRRWNVWRGYELTDCCPTCGRRHDGVGVQAAPSLTAAAPDGQI